MYCKNCGTKLPDTAKFCGYCGTPVEQPKAAAPTAPVAEPVIEPAAPVAEPVIEPVASVAEPVIEPVAETSIASAAWEEPVNEMEWEAPAGEEVWDNTDNNQNPAWEETNNTGTNWSDTWSETAAGTDWNMAAAAPSVPLIIEPKKKRSVALTILTILGIVALAALLVISAVLMTGGDDDSYDDVWHSGMDKDYYEDYEDELEDYLEDEYEESYTEDSHVKESSVAEPTGVTLECGYEIPFDAMSVDLSGLTVNNLMGIEQCTMLQNVRINGGSLTDLSPLLSLTQLNSLTLNNVPVSDIRVLKNMPSLMYLDITDTQVSAQQVKDLQTALPNITIIGYVSHSYEICTKDCTWEEAKVLCEERNGHLVTIADEAEMEKVKSLLVNTNLKYFWMGGYSQGDDWYWITGEPWGGYLNWFPGEPSKQDTDGTLEDRLCLWNVDDNGWTMNDQRNDLPSFSSTQGKIGYICEYEAIAGYQE